MQEKSETVGPMKKISMQYTAGSTEKRDDIISSPEPMEFIFGLGSDGLTPFEYELEGRTKGDKVLFHIPRHRVLATFGHLLSNMGKLPVDVASFYLNFEITGIGEAGPRELVQALAAATACGGDCDCGCGGH